MPTKGVPLFAPKRISKGQGREHALRRKGGGEACRSIYMPQEMAAQIAKQAKRNKSTKAELILTYLQWGLENDGHE